MQLEISTHHMQYTRNHCTLSCLVQIDRLVPPLTLAGLCRG